jgi:gluconolactonase
MAVVRRLTGALLLASVVLASCGAGTTADSTSTERLQGKHRETIGFIERLSPELDQVISPDAEIEVLASNLVWSEGPLWIPDQQWLLVSDVKENRIYRWSETDGLQIYLQPTGFTGTVSDSREPGSNGLALDSEGRLVIAQHGDRRVARMTAPLDEPKPEFESIATHYDGRRLNSPNDLVVDRAGNLYFTDPPFGLSELMMDDPNKELPFQGVYRVNTYGELTLLTDAVTRPNGLAFSPDEETLYVANTGENHAVWYAFPVNADGTLGVPEEIYDATELIGEEVGFPDGVKVNDDGYLFTAGPGGLWIFNPNHELIGKVRPGEWVSNCAFDEDFKTLYITADDFLLRVRLQPE